MVFLAITTACALRVSLKSFPEPVSLRLCVSNGPGEEQADRSPAASSGWLLGSVNGPLSWNQPFVQWGQCVAFTGDSSLGSDDHTMGKEAWSPVQRVPPGRLGGCTAGAEGGREGFVSLRTKESGQPAVGQVEQPKGCEKIKSFSLAGSAFLF